LSVIVAVLSLSPRALCRGFYIASNEPGQIRQLQSAR
jgi:hypothetical protein